MNSSRRTVAVRQGIAFACCCSLLAASGDRVAGHEESTAPRRDYSAADRNRPTPEPDRVVLTWSADPTSTIDVTWRTALGAAPPVVEYAPADLLQGDLRERVPNRVRVSGSSCEFDSDLGTALIHSAHLKDLQPGAMYAYRVGDGEFFSEWFQFRTASESNQPFTFVYFGDAQNEVRSWWSRVVREANQHAPRAAFMLHAGDLVNNGNDDAEWGDWFAAGGWLNGMIPSIACPGNHEYEETGEGDQEELSGHWRPQFAFPQNGPEGLEESVYWIDYQGARIISLNSNEQIGKQTAWLEKVLQDDARPKWTIATFHHPIYSAAKERDNRRLRDAWQPLLEKNGVDLVLQGHDHAYARSGLGGPVNVPEGLSRKSSNTVYVVSVSGPKMYNLQDRWEVPRVASGVQLFQVIRVEPEKISYEARLATGELYDAFTLEKRADGRSVLTEQEVATDEIRR